MKMSDTIAELATALAKAQGQIDDASKASENPYYKSKYADLAAVRAVIREPLATNDLAIIQAPRTVQGGAEVETMIVHKSGEYMSETLYMPAGKNDPHGYASAITYARRIGIMSLLALASYDDDGNTAVDSVKNAPEKKKPSADVMVAANKAAKEGTPALTAWWQSLPKEDRALIDNETVRTLKATAKAADGVDE